MCVCHSIIRVVLVPDGFAYVDCVQMIVCCWPRLFTQRQTAWQNCCKVLAHKRKTHIKLLSADNVAADLLMPTSDPNFPTDLGTDVKPCGYPLLNGHLT